MCHNISYLHKTQTTAVTLYERSYVANIDWFCSNLFGITSKKTTKLRFNGVHWISLTRPVMPIVFPVHGVIIHINTVVGPLHFFNNGLSHTDDNSSIPDIIEIKSHGRVGNSYVSNVYH